VLDAVNSRRFFRGLAASAVLGLCALSAAPAGAERPPERPLLFGGGAVPKKAPVQKDPWLPTGARVAATAERPRDAEPPGCSFRYPVCVHRGPGVDPGVAAQALVALENAHARLVEVLRLPAPAADAGLGGTDALDLYLAQESSGLEVSAEPIATLGFDRAAAHCRLGRAAPHRLARDATLCVGEAVALGLDPAETPHLRRAYATHLWHVVGYPTGDDLESLDDVQANPERAIATREVSATSEGAALFFDYLDATRGYRQSGSLATSLLSVAANKTSPAAFAWDNAPDVFDALRRSLDDSPRDMATLMAGFAVERAFLGARDDGTHLPALMWAGAFGRPRFDWFIKLSSLPRRVASLRPIEPTGAMYVWVDLDVPLGEKELAIQAEWESPVSFQWAVVKLDAEGRELGRHYAPFLERGTAAQQTLSSLEGVKSLLIAGTNLGGVTLAHPFDPDYAPFEPHGCTVYLTKL
jgi:hypothetical protein